MSTGRPPTVLARRTFQQALHDFSSATTEEVFNSNWKAWPNRLYVSMYMTLHFGRSFRKLAKVSTVRELPCAKAKPGQAFNLFAPFYATRQA